jgi:hypothetical protein
VDADKRSPGAGGGVLGTVDAGGCGALAGVWLSARALWAPVLWGRIRWNLSWRPPFFAPPRARQGRGGQAAGEIGSGGWSGAGA